MEVKVRAGIDSYLAVLGADLLTQRIRVDQQFLVHDPPGPGRLTWIGIVAGPAGPGWLVLEAPQRAGELGLPVADQLPP